MLFRIAAASMLTIATLAAATAQADVLCDSSGNLSFFAGVSECPAGLVPIDLNAFVKVKRGPKGPKGEKGLQGAQGPTGPTGKIGKRGPIGPKGDVGPQGAAGPQGYIGEQGARGPTGDKGAVGPKGDTGAKGDKGPSGAGTGPVGPAGDKGPTGPEGLTGPAGPIGDAGAKGTPMLWAKVVNNSCVAKSDVREVTVPTGTSTETPYDATVTAACDSNYFLMHYSFSSHSQIGNARSRLKVPPQISIDYDPQIQVIDRISAAFKLKYVPGESQGSWETANYSYQLICCPRAA